MTAGVNGFVHIVESPAPKDLLDGRTEGQSLSEFLKLGGIASSYSLATDAETFVEAMTTRLDEAKKQFPGCAPIIHLSMHGNTEGLGLLNGQIVTWDTLQKLLQPVMDELYGGLLINISSCSGYHGCRMAMNEDDRHPYWALIGNMDDAAWDDAAIAFVTFYHQFFKTGDLEKSVEAMRIASGDYNFGVNYGKTTKENWIAQMERIRSGVPLQSAFDPQVPNAFAAFGSDDAS